jgi:hypothetical protein
MPGRLVSVSERPLAGVLVRTYTVSSRTNISFLGSFMTLSHRYLTRKATFDGTPDSSLLGIERLYFFWLSNSNSSPPLRGVSFVDGSIEKPFT